MKTETWIGDLEVIRKKVDGIGCKCDEWADGQTWDDHDAWCPDHLDGYLEELIERRKNEAAGITPAAGDYACSGCGWSGGAQQFVQEDDLDPECPECGLPFEGLKGIDRIELAP